MKYLLNRLGWSFNLSLDRVDICPTTCHEIPLGQIRQIPALYKKWTIYVNVGPPKKKKTIQDPETFSLNSYLGNSIVKDKTISC